MIRVHDPLRENIAIASINDPETLAALVIKERQKERDERFKRLIGQRDIGSFFAPKKQLPPQKPQHVPE